MINQTVRLDPGRIVIMDNKKYNSMNRFVFNYNVRLRGKDYLNFLNAVFHYSKRCKIKKDIKATLQPGINAKRIIINKLYYYSSFSIIVDVDDEDLLILTLGGDPYLQTMQDNISGVLSARMKTVGWY